MTEEKDPEAAEAASTEPVAVEAATESAAVEPPTSSPPTPAPSDKEDTQSEVEHKETKQQQEAVQVPAVEDPMDGMPREQEQERRSSPASMPEGPDDLPIPTAMDPAAPPAPEPAPEPTETPVVEQGTLDDPQPLAPLAPPLVAVEAVEAAVTVAVQPPTEEEHRPEPASTPDEPAAAAAAAAPSASNLDPMALSIARRQYFSDDDEIDDELFSAERGLYSLSSLAGSRSAVDLVVPLEAPGSDDQLEGIRYDPILPTFAKHDDEEERIQKKGAIVIKVPTVSQGFLHSRGGLPELQRTVTPEPYEEIVIPTLGPIKEDVKGEGEEGEPGGKLTDSLDAMMRIHRPDPNMIGRMRFDDEDLYGAGDDDDYDLGDYAGELCDDAADDANDDLDAFLDELDDKPKPKAHERKRANSEQKVNPMFITTLNTDISDAERGIITYDEEELKKKQQLEDGGLKEKALEVLESAQDIAEHAFGRGNTYAEKAGTVVAKALKLDDKVRNPSMFRWIGFGLVAAVILIVLLVVGLVLGSTKKAVVSAGGEE